MKNIFIIFVLIIMILFIQSCSKKPVLTKKEKFIDNTLHSQVKTDYQIILAEHKGTESSDTSSCGMTDYELNSKFKVLKNIKGDLKIIEPVIEVLNCNHYYEQPFVGRKYDGLHIEYDFKWLLLLVKKNNGYFLVESELVFSLKDKRFAFCAINNKIQNLLNLHNDYLGEEIGSPIILNNNKEFFKKSECYTVKGNFAYLDQGVILEDILED